MTDLNGKTVLVTGGSRGIGAAMARAIGAAALSGIMPQLPGLGSRFPRAAPIPRSGHLPLW